MVSVRFHQIRYNVFEPITDDIPCLEAPIAVVYPDQSNEGDSSSRNGTIRELDVLEPSVLPALIEKETADITASPNEPKNNGELAMTSSSRLEIASTPYGEMKLSLSFDSARGNPDFQMPSLGTILKAVEDKYLRTCRGLDPNFSLMNVMKEVCYSGLELGSGSNNKSLETIDNDSLLLPPCNDVDDNSHLKKMVGGDDMETNSEKYGEETNNLSLVVVNQLEVTPEVNPTVDSKFDPKTPCNGVDDDSHQKKMDGGDYLEANSEKHGEETNSLSLMLMKNIDTLNRAIEVESKKMKREVPIREKDLTLVKMDEKIRTTNSFKRTIDAS